jgi:hypothetical protein
VAKNLIKIAELLEGIAEHDQHPTFKDRRSVLAHLNPNYRALVLFP